MGIKSSSAAYSVTTTTTATTTTTTTVADAACDVYELHNRKFSKGNELLRLRVEICSFTVRSLVKK